MKCRMIEKDGMEDGGLYWAYWSLKPVLEWA